MAGESEEVKFSLGGKCEQRPWLVLKMPVGRQAKHETCVGGMAMVLYSDQCPNSELADGTSTVVAVFFSQGQGRWPGEPPSTEFALLAHWPTRIVSPRTENKNRMSSRKRVRPPTGLSCRLVLIL
jgi:hypothetical protein